MGIKKIMDFDPIEKLFKKGKEVALNERKKDAMQREILMFMEKNPINGGAPKKSWFGFFGHFRLKTPMVSLASIMLVLLVGGITSVSANSALPGNFLYPMKVGFNEKIREVLAFSDEAKLEVSMALAELRLQEIEQLAIEGKKDSRNEAAINSNFNHHAKKASVYLDKLNETGNNEKIETMSANFEASLRAHKTIIESLQNEDSNSNEAALADDIITAASSINANAKTNATMKVRSGAAKKDFDEEQRIREKISSVENSVGIVKKLIENNKTKIGSEAKAQLEDNLMAIQEKIDEGKNKLSEDGYGGSFSSLHDASVIAQESRDLINTANRLGIKIDFKPRHGRDEDKSNNVRQNNQPVEGENEDAGNFLEASDLR